MPVSLTSGAAKRAAIRRVVYWKNAFVPSKRATSTEVKQLPGGEDGLRETIRALLRRDIIEPTADGNRIIVPLIAHYVRNQRRPI